VDKVKWRAGRRSKIRVLQLLFAFEFVFELGFLLAFGEKLQRVGGIGFLLLLPKRSLIGGDLVGEGHEFLAGQFLDGFLDLLN